MCGVVGIVSQAPVNQLIYDSLLLLQHRGQDAAGIATAHGSTFHMYKASGMVRDVFRTRNMRALPGTAGIGHVRYPTAGSVTSEEEAQPFYVNAPFGIILAHNGNLTNYHELRHEMVARDRRHINTSSDTEILLNVFADELQRATTGNTLTVDAVFTAVAGVHQRVRGSYAVVALVAGLGLLAFRDPHGIRPLCLGTRQSEIGKQWMVASESVALEGSGFHLERDIAPGEAIIVDVNSQQSYAKKCSDKVVFTPCVFEYVYLARPDSCIDNVPVYDVRLRMGDYLAEKILRELSPGEVDVVMPIPDSSRPAAMQVAKRLGVPYREGFYKNRYVGRTFIMPGQAIRKKSVRQKLNAMPIEFKGKCVLIVDDSIVRGTTSQEIIQMARDAGAARVIFASAAPPVRFPNVYGIDMPTRSELVAHGRSLDEIRAIIGADQLIYQDLADLKRAICDTHAGLENFESSCFDGIYVTGDIDAHYLEMLEAVRRQPTILSTNINDGQNGSHLHLQQHFLSE